MERALCAAADSEGLLTPLKSPLETGGRFEATDLLMLLESMALTADLVKFFSEDSRVSPDPASHAVA